MTIGTPVRVGLITDIHYDGSAVALNRLYNHVNQLNAGGAEALVLMGDLVNGACETNAKRLLREVSALCDSFNGKTYFMPGNHDLDHLSKAEFYNALGRVGDPARFHFETGGYTFICVDCNFTPEGGDYNLGNFKWEEACMPPEEIEWLRARISASLNPVILISHQRIDKETRFAVRNYDQVRKTITLSEKVKAVFQGHNHEDDLLNFDGTSYYTLSAHVDDAGPAMLDLRPQSVRLIRDFQPLETV
ncbi:metallophosphoesterase family protein [Pontiella agarivorans]|uniref:Metallophosphoesterase n=1 Tax=Pontiella agarivorans TaxID=3038953 RepID=A0ABU5MWJ8_9BACT|nr:metallophosphoesterase [Pontiella agarivorans]MDZ8118611.1 metallophosphoesterase [Pontiella agarivorans]